MRPSLKYTPCPKCLRGQTGDKIMFEQFKEENLLSETRNNAGKGDKYDENLIMLPLLREGEMDVMDSGDGSDDEPMYTEMLEDICDGSQSHSNVNRGEACYKIRDFIKQRQSHWKETLKATQNICKCLHKMFTTDVKDIFQDLTSLGESGS